MFTKIKTKCCTVIYGSNAKWSSANNINLTSNNMEQTQTQTCSNCSRAIPSGNIDTHMGYCLRNIKRCEQCGDPIQLSSMENHKTTHECDNKCTTASAKRHKAGCPMRPMPCGYCQVQLPRKDLEIHQNDCPLKTIVCPVCNLPVVSKNYAGHLLRCRHNLQEVRNSLQRISHRQSDKQIGRKQAQGNSIQEAPRDASIDKICSKKPSVGGGNLVLDQISGKRLGLVARANSPRNTPKPTPFNEEIPSYNKLQYPDAKPTGNLCREISILPVSLVADRSKMHVCFFPGVKPVSGLALAEL